MSFGNVFNDVLRRAIDPDQQLPSQLHLGKYVYSWENGKRKYEYDRAGFRRLTPDELRQLMRRLQAVPQSHVIFLNLGGQRIGADMMREMAAIIKELKALQVLILEGTSLSLSPSSSCTSCSCICFLSAAMRCVALLAATVDIILFRLHDNWCDA
jgi:hypothetical protein